MIKEFPHYSTAAKRDACAILTAKYGDTGYAFWFRLLEYLNQNDAEPIDVSNEDKFFSLALYCHPCQNDFIKRRDETIAMLDFCASYKDSDGVALIDPELWQERKVWSKKNRENVDNILRKRKNYKPASVDETSLSFRFVKRMFTDIADFYPSLKRKTEKQVKATLYRWTPELETMMSRKHTTIEEMAQVWKWLYHSTDKDALFWKQNVRSVKKFMQHYDLLLKKSNTRRGTVSQKADIFNR